MQILKTSKFFIELEVIIDFIAQNSFNRAEQFKSNLDTKVNNLPNFPYKCRRSLKSNDESVRDLIFSGYVIPYRVNEFKNTVEILGIFSENEWTIYETILKEED